jgi:hypothetical protein
MFDYIKSIISFEAYHLYDNGSCYFYGSSLRIDLNKGLKSKDYFDIAYFDSELKQITFYADDNLFGEKYIYSLKDVGEYNV